jgi:signal transduction histidine kinase
MASRSLIELIELLTDLIGEGIHKFDVEDSVKESYINQGIISELIRYSFEENSIEQVLKHSLKLILSLNWLAVESKGCVFLAEEPGGGLILKAQENLPEELSLKCAKVKLGECLCGKAADEKQIRFSASVDESHSITYEGIPDHGHYCVPVMFGEKLLGVLNLYLPKNSRRDPRKEEFLSVFSNTLAGIIVRRRAQENLSSTQKELADARRLSDIGTLAATVAHELRNPLAAVSMAAYNIKRKAQNPLLTRHLENIEIKVKESEQIISNLLFYSRLKDPTFGQVNIYNLLQECVAETAGRFPKRKIKALAKFKELKNVFIEADQLQIKELFSNILNNAYDAVAVEGPEVEITGIIQEPSVVKVVIKDNGCGIEEQHLARVFEPFFSTKAKGTGLGLAVCYQITKLHKGTINIESLKGAGTQVSVILPVRHSKYE